MQKERFVTYQRFYLAEEAEELATFMMDSGIDAVVEDESASFSPTFTQVEQTNCFSVKIKQGDFQRADQVQVEFYEKQIESIDKDYYLFSWTNEELKEVIARQDEWSKLDYVVAKKILQQRGSEIPPETERTLGQQRKHELSKPQTAPEWVLLIGYLVALLGGVVAIVIGSVYFYSSKTLPDGTVIRSFDKKSRQQAKTLIIFGTIMLLTWTVLGAIWQIRGV